MSTLKLSDFPERYAMADPSGGKQPIKRTRSRSAIVVIALDELGRLFVLHSWADRCSTDTFIEAIFSANSTWHPRVFGCEADALQSLFADTLAREARFKSVRLPLVPVKQPKVVDKDFRIRAILQPVIAHGRLFVQERHVELRAELASFPMSVTKDLVDALASCVALVPPRSTRRERDTELEALASYLRATGTPPDQIEARLVEVGGHR